MWRLIFSFILLPCLLFADADIKIKKYELAQGKLKFRYGSGIAFAKASSYGSISFYLFSGGDFLITDGKENRISEKVPHIALAKLRKDKFKIAKRFPLFFQQSGKTLQSDLEGIATAPDDIIWLADEATNSILKVSNNAAVLEQISLSKTISATPNRGLEGITVAPDGKVYASLQSIVSGTKDHILLIQYDPVTKAQKSFGIRVNPDEYTDVAEIKIGDLQAIDSKRFLVAEHGAGENGKYLNRIFIAEFAGDDFMLSKKLLLDLNEYGWKYNKLEGLTLIDASTIGIINDWDDDITKNEFWVITLSEPLITWDFKEWFLFIVLLVIFIFSTALTAFVIFKK